MKLKFKYQRLGGQVTDLIAEIEARTTVGQLAAHLQAAEQGQVTARHDEVTLTLQGVTARQLNPEERISESALASGAVVAVTAAPRSFGPAPTQAAVVRATVVSGPDRGRQFELPLGAATIGRERDCDIRLTDGRVSRRHARLNVGETVEIIDEASANGVLVGDTEVQRATLTSGEIVTIGDTEIEIARLRQTQSTQGPVAFVRPARVVCAHEGREFESPVPPEKSRPQRFPTIALLVPLLLGGILYATTNNWHSIIFVALSPLMLVGNAVEGRIVSKREFRKATEVFRAELNQLAQDVAAELSAEAVARRREHPAAAEAVPAATERNELLWSRRPDLPGFLEVRLGLGKATSRSTIKEPLKSKAPYELVRELVQAIDGLRYVEDVPMVAELHSTAVGIAGPRTAALPAARALVAQIAALHSPAEVVIAGMFSADTVADWDWLKWLPHSSSAHSPLSGRHLVSTPDGATVMAQLEALLRGDERSTDAHVVLVLDGALAAHARLVALAERGADVGIHTIWLAAHRSVLPAACKVYLEVSENGDSATAAWVSRGDLREPVVPDAVGSGDATVLAQALAPIDDVGAQHADDSDLPRSVSQLETLGDLSLADSSESVVERWQSSNSILTGPFARPEPLKRAGSLRAVLGMGADGPHALDLRTDGPHALVGGSTNSGKSELLQSWILSMAATHSPERVTFLLVDYKGGSAFGDCVNLPHTIGLVTDLSPMMVRRALTSLAAELKYREHLLKDHDAKDLIELEKHGIKEAPPSLIIVVDEFAALVSEVPEFIDGVVNVAARGRSLGLHLILATQQPAGVIRGSLRANTNLRIALRVTDIDDSNDVIGAPDAAGFDPQIPGRAMSRSGPKRLVGFQTAYAGGWTSAEPAPPEIKVEELTLGTPAPWNPPSVESGPKNRETTDIKRLVRTIVKANEVAGLRVPRKAWLPVLPTAVDVTLLPRSRRDTDLVFALGDDPHNQSQPPVSFNPDREGSMAVYGTSGSGKSTLLRAVAIAAGFTQRGGPCHVYGLDFGSRALQMLETLPYVGSIVPGSDGERVMRLLTWLRETIDDRRTRYTATNSSTITEYRARTGQSQEARIILLVDNVGAFRAAYEGGERQRYVDMLAAIAGEGRAVGVHVIVTAGERTGVSTNLSSAMQRRIVMRMASDDDYSMLGVPADMLGPTSSPGRAVDSGYEIQVGILGVERDDASQAARLQDLTAALTAAGASLAPPVLSLPADIQLAGLVPGEKEVTIGMDGASLAAASVDAVGGFLVTGPPGSGRSTALRTLMAGARRGLPGCKIHYFGSRRSALARAPEVTQAAFDPEDVAEAAHRLAGVIAESAESGPRFVVIVEGAGDFVMSVAEGPLQALVKACGSAGHWFIAEGEVSTVRSPSGFLGAVKSSRRGLALQPDQETGSALFNTPFPRTNRAEFPEGRGFLVSSGRAALVQIAQAQSG